MITRQLPGGSTTRRTVVKGAAWSVPVVAMASPANAVGASQCVVQTTFDHLQVGTCVGGPISFSPSTVTATVSYQYNVPSSRRGSTCQVARTSTTPSFSYVEIEMLNPRASNNDYIDVTITLSQPMENLSFTIHDIDSTSNGWRDEVVILTSGYTSSLGSTLEGAGSSTDPFRRSSWGDNPINSGSGAVTVSWAGPIQEVSFRYRAGINGNSSNQHVALSRISFTDCLFEQQPRRAVVVPDIPQSSTMSTMSSTDDEPAQDL